VGWYDKNNEYETKPVGLKFPNELEIYDMSGNVWEWCIDRYDYNFYNEKSKQINPANLGNGSVRLLRGGFWNDGATPCRTDMRGLNVAGDRVYTGGFRLLFAFQFT